MISESSYFYSNNFFKNYNRYIKEYYLIQRNLIISILFLIQHNCILTQLVVYKQTYDIASCWVKGSVSVLPYYRASWLLLLLRVFVCFKLLGSLFLLGFSLFGFVANAVVKYDQVSSRTL